MALRPLKPRHPFPETLHALSARALDELQCRVNEELFRECNRYAAPKPVTLSRYWRVFAEVDVRAYSVLRAALPPQTLQHAGGGLEPELPKPGKGTPH